MGLSWPEPKVLPLTIIGYVRVLYFRSGYTVFKPEDRPQGFKLALA